MAESLTQVHLATDEVNIVVDTVPQHLPCEIVMETAPRPLLLIQITGLDPWIALRPFVHPGTHQGMPYYDAWRLGEWYVELVLLHMLSFQGEYSNRIKHRWVGEVERVPWA